MGFSKAEIEKRIDRKIEYVGNKYGNNLKEIILDILGLERMLHSEQKENRLIPLPKWNDYYNYPTVSGMRMKVFYADNNGFNDYGVVYREGKRVFIDEQAYLRWQRRYSDTNK